MCLGRADGLLKFCVFDFLWTRKKRKSPSAMLQYYENSLNLRDYIWRHCDDYRTKTCMLHQNNYNEEFIGGEIVQDLERHNLFYFHFFIIVQFPLRIDLRQFPKINPQRIVLIIY